MEKKFMYELPIFDDWLNKKSDEVISKVNRETITNEETLILILKSQNEYFKKLDQRIEYEFNKYDLKLINSQQEQTSEFDDKLIILENRIDLKLQALEERIELKLQALEERIELRLQALEERIELKLLALEERINNLEKRIEKIENRLIDLENKIDKNFIWTIGFMAAGFAGIYIKLFFM